MFFVFEKLNTYKSLLDLIVLWLSINFFVIDTWFQSAIYHSIKMVESRCNLGLLNKLFAIMICGVLKMEIIRHRKVI